MSKRKNVITIVVAELKDDGQRCHYPNNMVKAQKGIRKRSSYRTSPPPQASHVSPDKNGSYIQSCFDRLSHGSRSPKARI